MKSELPTPSLKPHELKSILYWAAIGISQSRGGSHDDAAGEDGLVQTLASSIQFSLPCLPNFWKLSGRTRSEEISSREFRAWRRRIFKKMGGRAPTFEEWLQATISSNSNTPRERRRRYSIPLSTLEKIGDRLPEVLRDDPPAPSEPGKPKEE